MGWGQVWLAMTLLGGAVLARDDLLCMPNEWSGRYFKTDILVNQQDTETGSLSEGWATFNAEKGYLGATETGDRMYNADLPTNYSLTIYQKGWDSFVSIASPIGTTPTCYHTNLTDRVPEVRCLTKVSDKWSETNFNMPNGGMYNGKYAQFAAINNDTHRSKNESVQIGFLEHGTNFPLTAVLAEYEAGTAELQMASFADYEAKFNTTLFQLPPECAPLSVVRGPEGDRVAGRESRRLQKAILAKSKEEAQAAGVAARAAGTEAGEPRKAQKPHKKTEEERKARPGGEDPFGKKTVFCQPPEATYELFAPTFFGAMVGNLSLSYEAAGATRFGFKGTILFNERAVDVRLIQYNGGPHGRIWFEYKDIFAPPNLPPFSPNIPYQPAAPTPKESKGGYHCNANGDGRYFAGFERCRNATGPREIRVNGRPAQVFKLTSTFVTGYFPITLVAESYVLRGSDGLMLGFMNATNVGQVVDWNGAATLFNPRPVADESVLLPPEHCENNYLPVPHDPFPPSLPTPLLAKAREQEQEEYDYARAPKLVDREEAGNDEANNNNNNSHNEGSLKDSEIRTIMDAILDLAHSF